MKMQLYIETYGCQMNVADSEVVASILKPFYDVTDQIGDAHLILLNTCSVRDNAEQRIRKRLKELNFYKKQKPTLIVGLLGCMAERVKEQLLQEEPTLDFIAGPDAYRSLPALIEQSAQGVHSFDILLSEKETYDDIAPIRYDTNGVSAFVSIMRGCNNFCTYCIVPFTRGRERSRSPQTILREVQTLIEQGFKEVTLLGQNVNSYHWLSESAQAITFAQLVEQVALLSPQMRVRFATSHPKDLSDELLAVMAKYDNVCKYIHLPVQAGSSSMLKRMNRSYTREHYLGRIAQIKKIMPDCAISTDVIAGFSGETEEEHQETLSVMKEAGYAAAYMFKYSVREGTLAHKRYVDDVPDEVKSRRLSEIIDLQQELSLQHNQQYVGQESEVLVEGFSKRSQEELFGRNSQNIVVIFPKEHYQKGDYVRIRIESCSSATLKGAAISKNSPPPEGCPKGGVAPRYEKNAEETKVMST
ncbi:MAG: tRNA (N6-isopentenyl adenosine(37)-C2)-methylthiotransferase MiaB [Bacteroidales bacterium]|jgi:tRNA-2-methylthio-N6-dimethylallyladenosine synthase|nr:tRNA (N6-isopentenyl adenosine(37)-C2)-methylthiotransferase MiaB [Bacteroidales bacterium]